MWISERISLLQAAWDNIHTEVQAKRGVHPPPAHGLWNCSVGCGDRLSRLAIQTSCQALILGSAAIQWPRKNQTLQGTSGFPIRFKGFLRILPETSWNQLFKEMRCQTNIWKHVKTNFAQASGMFRTSSLSTKNGNIVGHMLTTNHPQAVTNFNGDSIQWATDHVDPAYDISALSP